MGQQRPNPATARLDHHQVAVEVVGEHPRRQDRDRRDLVRQRPVGVPAPVGQAHLDQVVSLLGWAEAGVDQPGAVRCQGGQRQEGPAEQPSRTGLARRDRPGLPVGDQHGERPLAEQD